MNLLLSLSDNIFLNVVSNKDMYFSIYLLTYGFRVLVVSYFPSYYLFITLYVNNTIFFFISIHLYLLPFFLLFQMKLCILIFKLLRDLIRVFVLSFKEALITISRSEN